jgi:hypothetical protein
VAGEAPSVVLLTGFLQSLVGEGVLGLKPGIGVLEMTLFTDLDP